MKRSTRDRLVALSIAVASFGAGCGPYRVRYLMPSQRQHDSGLVSTRTHAHGIGVPLGGGAFFFVFHQMFPALVDYSGQVNVEAECPNGFAEISHHHTFAQNTLAAFLSWLFVLNVYHQSNIDYRHAAPRPPGP